MLRFRPPVFCWRVKLLQFVVLLLLTYNLLSPVLILTLTTLVNTTWERRPKDYSSVSLIVELFLTCFLCILLFNHMQYD